jgi:hypothetical protein
MNGEAMLQRLLRQVNRQVDRTLPRPYRRTAAEGMATPTGRGFALTVCQHAARQATALRRAVRAARQRGNASQIRYHQTEARYFARRWANQALGLLPQLSRAAVGITLPSLHGLRAAARQRLGHP